MICCCEIFNLYLKIYYSTAEWSDDDHDFDFDYGNADEQYSHAEIIDQCDFRQVHLIDSHVYSNTTLLQPRENTQFTSDSVSDKGDINDGDHGICATATSSQRAPRELPELPIFYQRRNLFCIHFSGGGDNLK